MENEIRKILENKEGGSNSFNYNVEEDYFDKLEVNIMAKCANIKKEKPYNQHKAYFYQIFDRIFQYKKPIAYSLSFILILGLLINNFLDINQTDINKTLKIENYLIGEIDKDMNDELYYDILENYALEDNYNDLSEYGIDDYSLNDEYIYELYY